MFVVKVIIVCFGQYYVFCLMIEEKSYELWFGIFEQLLIRKKRVWYLLLIIMIVGNVDNVGRLGGKEGCCGYY